MKKLLIVLLILIILLVGIPFAYLSLSGGEYDNPAAVREPVPAAAGQRYVLHPSTRSMEVLVSKPDVYYLIRELYGADLSELANRALADYGLELTDFGFQFRTGGLSACARLRWKGFLPIPVSAEYDLSETDGVLSGTLKTVSIGNLIRLDGEKYRKLAPEISIDLPAEDKLFQTVIAVRTDAEGIRVRVPYPMEWLTAGLDVFPSEYTTIIDFVDPEELDTPLSALRARCDGDSEPLIALLDACGQDPARFIELKADLVGIGGYYARYVFQTEQKGNYAFLLYPELTAEYLEACHDRLLNAYQKRCDERTGVLSDAFAELLTGFAEGTVTVRSGKLVYNTEEHPEVTARTIAALEGTDDWLDLSTVRPVLAYNCGDATLRAVPTGNNVTALILRTHTGRPVVAYRYTSDSFKIKSLLEEDYLYFMGSETTPTVDLGEYTTKR